MINGSPQSNLRILVIDDSKVIRNRIKRILTNNHYQNITTAANGEEAMQKFSEVNPELVLLDIILPDTTGIELLEKFLATDPDLPVIMLSAILTDDNVNTALKLGAKTCLEKPFQEEDLISWINKVV